MGCNAGCIDNLSRQGQRLAHRDLKAERKAQVVDCFERAVSQCRNLTIFPQLVRDRIERRLVGDTVNVGLMVPEQHLQLSAAGDVD